MSNKRSKQSNKGRKLLIMKNLTQANKRKILLKARSAY